MNPPNSTAKQTNKNKNMNQRETFTIPLQIHQRKNSMKSSLKKEV